MSSNRRRKSAWLEVEELDKQHEQYVQRRINEENQQDMKKILRVKNRRRDQRARFHRRQQQNFQKEDGLGTALRDSPVPMDRSFQPHDSWRARQKKDWRFYRRTGNLWDDPYHIPPERRKIVIHRNMLEAEIDYIERVKKQVEEEETKEKDHRCQRVQSVKDLQTRLKASNFHKNHKIRSLSTHNLLTVARPMSSPGIRGASIEAQIMQYKPHTAPLDKGNVRRASLRACSTPKMRVSSSNYSNQAGAPPGMPLSTQHQERLSRLALPKVVKPRLELYKEGSNDFRGLLVVDRAMTDLVEDFEKSKPFQDSNDFHLQPGQRNGSGISCKQGVCGGFVVTDHTSPNAEHHSPLDLRPENNREMRTSHLKEDLRNSRARNSGHGFLSQTR